MPCLRKVSKSDVDVIYKWANDPITRQNSFSDAEIPYENHVRWFEGKLKDSHCLFYICEDIENEETKEVSKAGSIRLDLIEDDEIAHNKALQSVCVTKSAVCYRISYQVAPDKRGRGYGSLLLKLAESAVIDEHPKGDRLILVGEVKKENVASSHCFLKNHYQMLEDSNELVYYKQIEGNKVAGEIDEQ